MISDTTDINHFSHKATTGLGILGDGVGRGMQLHNCLMYDCKSELIHGAAGALLYYRQHKPKNEKRIERLARARESDICEIAKLDGFLARKGDGEPGWQTVWRGFQKMQLLLDGMRLAGAICT